MVDRFPLSEGSLKVIMQGGQVDNPVMQVLGSKKIASGSSDKERYRILLSDGKYLISFAMFTTQINERVVSGELPAYSIIKIKRYITSVINNTGKGDKRVLVILDVETLVPGDMVNSRIGSPEQLPEEVEPQSTPDAFSSIDGSSSNKVVTNGSTSGSFRANTSNSNLNQSLQNQLTHPISSLSPYQNKWVIRARVTNKSQIRTWSNSRGEGKLFSFDLVDESGEIRVTAFRDLVDKFYDIIEVDKVYYISKCMVKVANKQFSTLKNDYEMTLGNESVIEPCYDEIECIPQTQFNFVTIDKISQMETNTMLDIIGVCKSVSDIVTFQARTTGRELKKREISLVDATNNAIALTLWGNEAENFDGAGNPVIAIKSAKLGEFGGGKNISTVASSLIKMNPDIPEAHRLRGWFDNGGVNTDVTNISARSGLGAQAQWMSFKQVKDLGLGSSERGDYYQVKGTILLVRHENIIYKACPSEDCNKKLINFENGMFKCEKCNREYPNFKYRLLGSMNVGDWSGNQWVSMFSSEVEKILGMNAQEVGEAIDNDSEALVNIACKANFKQFILKCRAKFEMYNDERRLKTVVIKVDPINYKEYNSYLISQISQRTNAI